MIFEGPVRGVCRWRTSPPHGVGGRRRGFLVACGVEIYHSLMEKRGG
jgi:hypothetical protein